MLSDLWGNRVRTLLVVASIAVGLFAVGMIATMHNIMSEDIRAGYAAVNPANVVIQAATFNDDIVDIAQKADGVKDAEGLRTFDLMVRTGSEEWSRIGFNAIKDFEKQKINQVKLVSGKWPPADHEIVIERNKLNEVALVTIGKDSFVALKLPSGKIREIKLVGVVHDQTLGVGGAGGFFLAPIQGYINADTLAWLEQPEDYSRLLITVTEKSEDEDHLREIANQVSRVIEDAGGLVYNAQVRGSHDHPNAAYVDAISGVLFVLGALVVFLSGFLITNTLQALLNQQSQQIAIMKTIGARSNQVTGIYIALIFVFGILALSISLPLSRQAAFRLVEFLSERINAEVLRYRIAPLAIYLQVLIALAVPQIAGIV
ncbi:MAG: FtsX-like permease family protein, partial [Anaerolineaceae bacterium]|nr:FtsX-like permease family protein [Anaerolineaceae bacterium]